MFLLCHRFFFFVEFLLLCVCLFVAFLRSLSDLNIPQCVVMETMTSYAVKVSYFFAFVSF